MFRYFDEEEKKEKKKKIEEKKPKKKKSSKKLKRILIIGPNGGLGCHVSENMFKQFSQLGYDTIFISPQDLQLTDLQKQQKRSVSLTNILSTKLNKWVPNLIFIDECNLYFNNMQSIPVIYHHREFKRIPKVEYPTTILFWHDEIREFYEKRFAPLYCAQVQYKGVLPIAYDPEIYQPQKKVYLGIHAIGTREGWEPSYKMNEITNIADLRLLQREHEKAKKYLRYYFEPPITDQQFREILPTCEAIWVPLSTKQYTSRVMLEAMACKTLVYLKLEGKEHEKILEQMGFKANEHYVAITDLRQLAEPLVENKDELIENAYQQVQHHTYLERAKQIITFYEKIISVK